MRRIVATHPQLGQERAQSTKDGPHAQGSHADAPPTLLEVTFRFLATDDAVQPYPHADGLPRSQQSVQRW